MPTSIISQQSTVISRQLARRSFGVGGSLGEGGSSGGEQAHLRMLGMEREVGERDKSQEEQ
jgi:hypothetical protein